MLVLTPADECKKQLRSPRHAHKMQAGGAVLERLLNDQNQGLQKHSPI